MILLFYFNSDSFSIHAMVKYAVPHTLFYYDGMLLQVVCGCFRGDLKEFETMVLKTHANNEVYRNQYLKEIAKVKTLFELEV